MRVLRIWTGGSKDRTSAEATLRKAPTSAAGLSLFGSRVPIRPSHGRHARWLGSNKTASWGAEGPRYGSIMGFFKLIASTIRRIVRFPLGRLIAQLLARFGKKGLKVRTVRPPIWVDASRRGICKPRLALRHGDAGVRIQDTQPPPKAFAVPRRLIVTRSYHRSNSVRSGRRDRRRPFSNNKFQSRLVPLRW